MSTPTIESDVRLVNLIAAVPTILEVVARTTGMGFVAVARVTETTWTACAVRDEIAFGLKPGGELRLETTICNEIRQHRDPVVFSQASVHPVFRHHRTPRMYGFESYISVPIIRSNGVFFGTLCAIDPRPARLEDPNILKTMQLFTQLIAAHLDIEEKLEQSAALLTLADETAKLREQFIAVLGHDLRNPLHAVSMAAAVLERKLAQTPELSIVKVINRSCVRMSELVSNVLDFARGKLGGGIPVSPAASDRLGGDLRDMISEFQLAHPDHVLIANIELREFLVCDTPRITQLLCNLLSNAIKHGDPAQPVRIDAGRKGEFFELSVANGGAHIPEAVREQLFEPFKRSAEGAASAGGLGLGLYIAAQIARAHRGTLELSSDEEGHTRFTFRMPLRAADPASIEGAARQVN